MSKVEKLISGVSLAGRATGAVAAFGVKAIKVTTPIVVAAAKTSWAGGKAYVDSTKAAYKAVMADDSPVAVPAEEPQPATSVPAGCIWKECDYWTSDGSGCNGFMGNCPHYPEGYNAAAAAAVADGTAVITNPEDPSEAYNYAIKDYAIKDTE